MLEFTEIGGFTLNGASAYTVVIPPDADLSYASTAEERARINQFPAVETESHSARTLPLLILRRDTTAIDQWTSNVNQIFSPFAGYQTIKGTYLGIAWQASAKVTNLRPSTEYLTGYEATLHLPSPVWEAQSTTTDAASPLTVIGNRPAQPVVTFTPSGTAVKVREITVQDRYGVGLVHHPIRVVLNSTGASVAAAEDYDVIVDGQHVPFYVRNWGAANTTVDLNLSVEAAGTKTFSIVYGAGVNQTTTAQALNKRGMYLDSDLHTNDHWKYRTLDVANNPDAVGGWRYGRIEASGDISYTPDNGAGDESVSIQVSAAGQSGFDALMLTTGTPLATGYAINGMFWSNQMRVLTRVQNQPGSTEYLPTPTEVTNGTYPAVAATEIAFVPFSTNILTRDLTTGEITVDLDDTLTPQVTVGAAEDAYLITGPFTNTTTGAVITFDDVLSRDPIVIDTVNQSIEPDDIIHGHILPSDPDAWFDLEVGANSWTNPTGASASLTWRSRLAV
jgi:hypothetical protein